MSDPIGDRAARYGEIEGKFPVWLEAIEVTTGDQQARFAVVGFLLGGALALIEDFRRLAVSRLRRAVIEDRDLQCERHKWPVVRSSPVAQARLPRRCVSTRAEMCR